MKAIRNLVILLVIFITIALASIWVGLFIFCHQPLGQLFTSMLLIVWGILSLLVIFATLTPKLFSSVIPSNAVTAKKLVGGFVGGFLLAVLIFFSLKPSNDRHWNPENAKLLDYSLAADGNTITLYNVRNFNWISPTVYQPHWETRQYQLDRLQSIDVITSHWMSDAIAHVLVSFGFSDGKRVALSIEIRKEDGEDFSNIAGFFRQYELIIIAADEKDIIYRRSNVTDQQVYIYPISYDKTHIRQLFMAYLNQAKALTKQPKWYNSLLNNCTTGIYQLLKPITPAPLDYRILLTGYIPDYLYDYGAIAPRYRFAQWRQRAHINPKTEQYSAQNPISSAQYSALIRRDF